MSKKPSKTDPRVMRTRQLLRDALIALIHEKGFDAVKTQDITARATLNRATFYLHYRDKNDLLIKSLHEVLEELDGAVNVPRIRNNRLSADAIIKPLVTIFEHFAQHAEFYRVMLCEAGVPSILDELQQYIETVALQWITELQPHSDLRIVDPNMVIRFASTAYIGVVKWWLENDFPHSTEQITEQFLWLISLGIFRSIGLEVPSRVGK